MDSKKIYAYMKRLFDSLFSMFILIIMSPIIILISIAIKLDSKGPILFKQQRIGKDMKVFTIYKFRTMRIDAPKDCPPYMFENPDIYITKIGKFLRKSSLDELPQLLNIIKGEMSIIGPRPSSLKEVTLQNLREDKDVHSVLPGLTGWAQINGRDEMTIQTKVKYDAEYIQNFGIKMDFIIFFKSIVKVLLQKNILEGRYCDDKNNESSSPSDINATITNTKTVD